jgi:cobalamin biosynthesis Mg chelatase CobN
MANDLPESLAELVQGLKDRGYTVTVDEVDESAFGDRLIEFHAPSAAVHPAVRLVSDRGLWNAEVDIGGEWEGTYQVLLALKDAPYSTRAESHTERQATTLAVVDWFSQERPEMATIKPRLDVYLREYWRRLGGSAAE